MTPFVGRKNTTNSRLDMSAIIYTLRMAFSLECVDGVWFESDVKQKQIVVIRYLIKYT